MMDPPGWRASVDWWMCLQIDFQPDAPHHPPLLPALLRFSRAPLWTMSRGRASRRFRFIGTIPIQMADGAECSGKAAYIHSRRYTSRNGAPAAARIGIGMVEKRDMLSAGFLELGQRAVGLNNPGGA